MYVLKRTKKDENSADAALNLLILTVYVISTYIRMLCNGLSYSDYSVIIQMIRKGVLTFETPRNTISMEFIVFLLFGIYFTNFVAGMDRNMNLSEDSLISQQTQIDFLVQKVSELSHTLELQGFEIDDLRKENQNLIQTVSEMKRTLCPSQAVTKDSGNKADINLEGNSARQHPGIIRKGLLMRIYT